MNIFTILSVIIWFILVQSASCSDQNVNKSSTLGVRLSLAGLQFFSDIGHRIVTKELPRLTLPEFTLPITGGPGTGEVHVSDMVLQKFESPKFNFVLAPDVGITWHSSGGALKLVGKWEASYTVLVKIYLSGTVYVTASDIKSALTLGAYGDHSHPQIAVYSCATDVQHLHMSLEGGVIPWLINLFKSPLSGVIKKAIHNQFCELTKTVLLREANEALMTLPTHVEITNNVFLDYGLLHNPEVKSTYVQGDALIDVTVGNKTCNIPFKPVALIAPKTDDFMANIWFSESVADCLLTSAHEQEMLKFVVDKNLQRNLTQFLRTTCQLYSLTDICFGKFFKKLRENYPNKYIDMVFESGKAPKFNISQEAVNVSTLFYLDIHINPYKKNPTPLARLEMTSQSSLEPAIFNDRIVGRLTSTDLQFKQVSSTIGNFNPLFLRALGLMLKPLITVAMDTAMRVGIPIPLVDNVTLGNTTVLVKLDNQIRVDANLVYV